MNILKPYFLIKHFIFLLALLFLLPTANAFADTTVNISTNGTIEVQAMVQEGFIEPITVELSGKDNYIAKLLVTADNSYVLRKQLPNGSYSVSAVYTNTKAESDSQMWASSKTVEIKEGKTSVLNVAVLDDTDGDAQILYGEENNPFASNIKGDSETFMAENAAKLETQNTENQQTKEENNNELEQKGTINNQQNEEDMISSEKQANTETETQTKEPQSAWDKLIDLIIRLARYILLSVFIMIGVSGVVWIYRRVKYGE